MVDKVPKDIEAGTANRGSTVHASDADIVGILSRGHLEEDISRVQSAVNDYDENLTYNVGDFTLFNNLTYRNITAIDPGESFDITKWIPVGGVGSKNVKHIFTEADFPAVETISSIDMHRLEHQVHYIIADEVVMADPLFLEAGLETRLSSFSDQNFLNWTGGAFLFRTDLFDGTFSSVASEGGQIKFFTGQTGPLANGDLINITSLTGFNYTQTRAVITNLVANTSFRIDGSFSGTSTGVFDNAPKILDLSDLKFQGDGANMLFDLDFTFNPFSEFYMFHCAMKDFSILGRVEQVEFCVVELCIFEEIGSSFQIRDTNSCSFRTNQWFETPSGNVSNVKFQGLIMLANVNGNFFQSGGVTDAAIEVDAQGGGELDADSRLVVTDNVDTREAATTLFQSIDGFDETDNRILAKNNVRQPNSIIGCQLNTNSTNFTVTINTQGVFVPIGSTNWDISSESQRFSLVTGPINGDASYDGNETTHVLVNYTITTEPDGANILDLSAGIFLNGTVVATPIVTRIANPINQGALLSGSVFLKIDPGDEIGLGMANDSNDDDLTIITADFSIVSIN